MGPWQNRLLVLVLIGALILFDNTQGQSSGALRLVARNGQTSPALTAGRLEVYYNGEWGTVCDDQFGTTEANVACRQLGYTEGSLYNTNVGFTSSSFATRFTQASSSTPIWFDSLDCSLSDSRLIDCASSIGVHDCIHAEDVVLFCQGDGAVRLSTTSFGSSVSTSAGRVEVYYNGVWGTVCDDFFGQTDADVVCQQLGYPSASTYGSVRFLGYSQGRGRIWLTDLACSSSDLMLSTCTSSGFGNTFGCSHSEDVAVICNTLSSAGSTLPPTPTTPTTPMPTVPPVTCTEFELQLGNAVHSVMDDLMIGTSRFSVSGTVEICLGGSFFSVCDEGWGQEEAQVTCNALNYPSTSYQAFPLIGLNTTRQVIAENIMCHGNETSARQCNFTAPPVSPRCYASSSAAGVECIQVRTPCINDGEINLLDLDYEGYLNIFTGDQVNVTGRVGVCRNGSYDSVCDVNWDANDAAVLCRTIIPQSTAIPVKGLSGGRDPVVLEDVRCFGNESNIANCSTSPVGQISNPVCLQPNRTAGVKCSTGDDYCVDGTLRLVDGPTFYEGRVEVCRNSQWLSVCDVGVNSTLATNACERRLHLGTNATAIHGSAYGPGMGPQLAFCEVYPSYTEIVPVENCTSNPGLKDLCSHNRDLGVRCQPGLLALSINADEVLTLGSSSFALECFGHELPWEARLVSVGWYKSGTQLSPNDSVSTEILHDSYNPSAFNATYIFRGRATFNRPLTISDGGEYSCNVSILLTYPDNSTHLLTNSTTYILGISVPPPTVTVTTNGTPNAGSRFEANCFAELPLSDLAPYTTIDYLDGAFNNLSEVLEETPDARVQLLPTRQYNATHLVRTIILDLLSHDHQGSYYCVANITVPRAAPSVAVLPVSLEVFSNISDRQIPQSFLPFGSDHGDLTAPVFDDGSTGEITLGTDIVIFGSTHNRLYVNTNGVLSFGTSYARAVGTNFNILSSPPIIAPFWDDVDITRGGTIYYRQDSNSTIMELVQKALVSEYPEAASFQPSLVFVATWDRVEPFGSSDRGRVNTFQVVVASDGTWTFVRFSYGDIQWGGVNTLIGVTAGDRVNFVTHPASLNTAVLLLYNTTTTYMHRVNESTTTMLPTTTTPPPPECFIQGEILPYLNETSHRGLHSFQGTFEICIGGLYGSVCDIGWNQLAAQTLCRDLYGNEYIAEPLYELGHPLRRYVAQHFNCSASTDGLESCSYNSLVDTQCFFGPHVAGVRCTERAPPPIGVQGMCSVIVWYSPAVQSCEDIRGYDVRLYNPQSPHLNITNRVGANGTFYIVDVDKLVSSEETYVQVRVIHSIGVGEWSEGTSLGCEKSVTTEMPPIARVYFELNGKIYHNNSAVSVSEIGEGISALYCRTDKEECCGTVPNRFGQFYYPNGVQVPIANRQQGFYRNRGNQIIRLNWREGITSPTGTYRCEIPNADDEIVRIFITLTE